MPPAKKQNHGAGAAGAGGSAAGAGAAGGAGAAAGAGGDGAGGDGGALGLGKKCKTSFRSPPDNFPYRSDFLLETVIAWEPKFGVSRCFKINEEFYFIFRFEVMYGISLSVGDFRRRDTLMMQQRKPATFSSRHLWYVFGLATRL